MDILHLSDLKKAINIRKPCKRSQISKLINLIFHTNDGSNGLLFSVGQKDCFGYIFFFFFKDSKQCEITFLQSIAMFCVLHSRNRKKINHRMIAVSQYWPLRWCLTILLAQNMSVIFVSVSMCACLCTYTCVFYCMCRTIWLLVEQCLEAGRPLLAMHQDGIHLIRVCSCCLKVALTTRQTAKQKVRWYDH